jgi:HEAT repeat protein
MEREELINRIVEEKGVEAAPVLLSLLVSEDSETAQICFDALIQMGKDVVPFLIEKMRSEDIDPVSRLYLADLAGEIGDIRAVTHLYELLSKYSDERSQIVIYEALARLGEGEKVVDVLALMLEENYDAELQDPLIMALSNTDSSVAVKALAGFYGNKLADKSAKAFALEGIHSILARRHELKNYLLSLHNGKEIAERLYQWQKEI